jgi:hypothetical protein
MMGGTWGEHPRARTLMAPDQFPSHSVIPQPLPNTNAPCHVGDLEAKPAWIECSTTLRTNHSDSRHHRRPRSAEFPGHLMIARLGYQVVGQLSAAP